MSIQTLGAVQTAYVSSQDFTLNIAATTLAMSWPSPYSVNPNPLLPPNIIGATNNLTVTAVGCNFNLPNANEVSLGMNIFVRNVAASTQPIQVNNYDGTAVQTIAAGEVWWIQLTAYSVFPLVGGVWFSTQMGANASQADAAALAGHGLQAVAARLNTITNVQQIAMDYTVVANDQSTLIVSNSAGALDLTLPLFGAGFYFSVNNVGNGTVNFVLPAGVKINNLSNFTLSSSQTMELICDGANWWSLGLGQNNGFASTIISINLADYFDPTIGGNIQLTRNQLDQFVHQYYIAGDVPVTANYTIYYGTQASDWYLSNFCHTTNGSTISVRMGIVGDPPAPETIIPMRQKIIVYAANDPLTDVLQVFTTPTTLAATSLLLANGTVAAPSLSFLSDQTSGMYLPAAFNPSIAGNGSQIVTFSATTAASPQILVNTGAGTHPAYSFVGSPTIGIGTAGLTLDLFATHAAPTATFITAGGGANSTFSLKAQTSGSHLDLIANAASGVLSYRGAAFTSSMTIATGASTGTFTFQSGGAPVTTLTTNASGLTVVANNGVFNSQMVLNGLGTDSVATFSVPGSPAIGTASLGVYNAIGLQSTLLKGGNTSTTTLSGTATATTFSIISSINGGNSTLSFTANDGGVATIVNNAINPISMSSTGIVTFPAQNAATLTALMPVSILGAIAYYNGAAWVTLPPGANGTVLTIAGGVPTWV